MPGDHVAVIGRQEDGELGHVIGNQPPLQGDRLADELTDLIWRGAEARSTDAPGSDATVDRLEAQVRRLEGALDSLLGASRVHHPQEER